MKYLIFDVSCRTPFLYSFALIVYLSSVYIVSGNGSNTRLSLSLDGYISISLEIFFVKSFVNIPVIVTLPAFLATNSLSATIAISLSDVS